MTKSRKTTPIVQPGLKVLISAAEIQSRVAALGQQINQDYLGKQPLVVGVLNGAFMFTADLIRHLTVHPIVDFLSVASYGAQTETSGVVAIRKDLTQTVTDQHVLVVEDIVDTGLTLEYLRRHLEAGRPASLRVCSLLDKPSRREVPSHPDYVGFSIADEFVVGYGLDFDQRYRELPAIHVLQQATS